jgi:8-oxo-dGTP diphosphatase
VPAQEDLWYDSTDPQRAFSQPRKRNAMPEHRHGAGVLFYDARERRVLLYRRDSTPAIPFPDHIDILGGCIEPGETPEQTVVREIAEELDDLRRGAPFVLAGQRLFMVYTDERGDEHHVFSQAADFDLADLRLKEGQSLLWLTEEDIGATRFAFGFERVVREFFRALREGSV